MPLIIEKLRESLFSVLPILVIVLLLHFTVSPLTAPQLLRFLLGGLLIILGLSVFLVGIEISIDPIGHLMGSAIAKTNRIWVVAIAGILLGFFISVAEPDLHILAGQVDAATAGLIPKVDIVIMVSLGIAAMLSIGLIRILYNVPLPFIFTGLYGLILLLSFFVSSEFLAISFDASGATTGALTVPFILALASGVSSLKKDQDASEADSFGLVAITSTGAILSVMLASILSRNDTINGSLPAPGANADHILLPFIQKLPAVGLEIALALSPILVLFMLLRKNVFNLSHKKCRKILLGMAYAFVGLVLLLTGVNAGFLEVGCVVGYQIAARHQAHILIGVAFVLGLATVLSEPAVHALTDQIETVTSGYVKRKTVLFTLSLGIGLAIALSMLRILIPGLQLWHFLLPGYLLAIALAYLTPPLFVGIAFDSGGVASGPMTATFILAFAQGAAQATEGANVLLDGFGIIAMVAMTPLIMLQLLGLIYKSSSRKGGIETDES